MRKAGTVLCGIMAAALLAGCGATMPDLTQEETDLISEYAVGVLLKYDKNHSGRLVDTAAYDVPEEEPEETPAETLPEEEPEDTVDDTEVIDVSQDEEADAPPSTIEEYYGISDITFQYNGYELLQSYPPATDDALFFAMDATDGMQLLVLRFTATNMASTDQTLNMLAYGARFRVSVNGEAAQNALSTMLLDDIQTYNDVIAAGGATELVCIVEVPQSVSIDTIDLIMRGGDENSVMSLQ